MSNVRSLELYLNAKGRKPMTLTKRLELPGSEGEVAAAIELILARERRVGSILNQ